MLAHAPVVAAVLAFALVTVVIMIYESSRAARRAADLRTKQSGEQNGTQAEEPH